MEDQQIEIKNDCKSPDIRVVHSLSPRKIAQSLVESKQFVCKNLIPDLCFIGEENVEAFEAAKIWADQGAYTYLPTYLISYDHICIDVSLRIYDMVVNKLK